jgi:nucleoside-diphosphate-sugar epimerase
VRRPRRAGADRLVAESVAFAYEPADDWIKDEDRPLALGARAPMDEIVAALGDLENQVLQTEGIVLRYGFLYGPGTQFARDGFYAGLVRKRLFPRPPLRCPTWVRRLAGGPATVMGMTTQRGASNAKARRELGWQPKYPSWRDGFRTAPA